MRVLLDTHACIWAVDDPGRLGQQAMGAIEDPANELLLSAGAIWEMAIKIGLGKLSLSVPFRQWMDQAIDDLGVRILPITVEYAEVQSRLPRHHGDPFDRLLVAQAQVEQVPIVSDDPMFDRYDIRRLW